MRPTEQTFLGCYPSQDDNLKLPRVSILKTASEGGLGRSAGDPGGKRGNVTGAEGGAGVTCNTEGWKLRLAGGARVGEGGKGPRDSNNTWSTEAVSEMRNSWAQLSLQARHQNSPVDWMCGVHCQSEESGMI